MSDNKKARFAQAAKQLRSNLLKRKQQNNKKIILEPSVNDKDYKEP